MNRPLERPRRASSRTYLVLVVPIAGTPRPLGTVEAPSRAGAQSIARAVHAEIPIPLLRVQSAGSASSELVARALALDACA